MDWVWVSISFSERIISYLFLGFDLVFSFSSMSVDASQIYVTLYVVLCNVFYSSLIVKLKFTYFNVFYNKIITLTICFSYRYMSTYFIYMQLFVRPRFRS